MMDEYKLFVSKIDISATLACSTSYVDSEDCSWYHQNWMTLRALGMVSNPFWHEQFFSKQLKIYFTQKNCKVLVLGTADFSMPLLCNNAGIEYMDICDICQTPLNICAMIAEQNHFRWHTFRNDVRDGIEEKYNIIVNDAFMTRFDYPEKSHILRCIGQALAPSGVYITTIRNDWNAGSAVAPSYKQQKAFLKKAEKSALKNGMDIDDVKKAATTYIEHIISFPMENESSVYNMAKGVLDVLQCNVVKVPGEYSKTSYFQIVFRNINREY
jgi:hypothetical protein